MPHEKVSVAKLISWRGKAVSDSRLSCYPEEAGDELRLLHRVPAAEHQEKFDALTAGSWQPKNISLVSLGGERFYTALYEACDTGSTLAKSFLTPAEYQEVSGK